MMLGQKCAGTLWLVVWTYRALANGDKPEQFVQNQRYVITADPAGGDLLEVCRMVALGGKPEIAEDFVIQQANRIGEVSGLGVPAPNDRAWITGINGTNALMAGPTEADLRRALTLKDIAIAELEKQLYALQRGGEEPRA